MCGPGVSVHACPTANHVLVPDELKNFHSHRCVVVYFYGAKMEFGFGSFGHQCNPEKEVCSFHCCLGRSG